MFSMPAASASSSELKRWTLPSSSIMGRGFPSAPTSITKYFISSPDGKGSLNSFELHALKTSRGSFVMLHAKPLHNTRLPLIGCFEIHDLIIGRLIFSERLENDFRRLFERFSQHRILGAQTDVAIVKRFIDEKASVFFASHRSLIPSLESCIQAPPLRLPIARSCDLDLLQGDLRMECSQHPNQKGSRA